MTFNEITQKGGEGGLQQAHAMSMRTLWMRSRPGVCSIVWSATRSARCYGIRCGAGLSAGRVQTVALRLIVEREREINAFKPVEYWTVDAAAGAWARDRSAALPRGWLGLKASRCVCRTAPTRQARSSLLSPTRLPDKEAVDEVTCVSWSGRRGGCGVFERKERRSATRLHRIRRASCSRMRLGRLGFNVRRTMGVAQRLYEGLEIGSEGHGWLDHVHANRFDARQSGC